MTTLPDDTRRLDTCAGWLYRPAYYDALPDDTRAAWCTAHDDLVAADCAVRNLQAKIGRARERRRTTEQYLATLHAELTAACDGLWDAYLTLEGVEDGWAATNGMAA